MALNRISFLAGQIFSSHVRDSVDNWYTISKNWNKCSASCWRLSKGEETFLRANLTTLNVGNPLSHDKILKATTFVLQHIHSRKAMWHYCDCYKVHVPCDETSWRWWIPQNRRSGLSESRYRIGMHKSMAGSELWGELLTLVLKNVAILFVAELLLSQTPA